MIQTLMQFFPAAVAGLFTGSQQLTCAIDGVGVSPCCLGPHPSILKGA